jgi:anti-sigma factor RsiW
MTEDFENELRRRLRPVNAPEGFAQRVLRALPAETPPRVVSSIREPARTRARQFGMPAALAASLLVAVLLGQRVAVERELRAEQQGLEASRELMQALRVTSRKLDLAYEAVNSPPPAGDEENRS